jgi:hypothetical protein
MDHLPLPAAGVGCKLHSYRTKFRLSTLYIGTFSLLFGRASHK